MSAPPLTVKVADRDVTSAHDNLTFSNSDPGGFEACQLNPQSISGIRPGAPVVIRCGLDYAWHGRLNEPGSHQQGDRDTFALAALGYGAALKDNPYQEIYVDVDSSRWQPISVQRNLNLISNTGFQSFQVVPDATTGQPSILTGGLGDWPSTARFWCEAWYNGGGISIGQLQYAWKKNANVSDADTNWTWKAGLSDDDVATTTTDSGNLRAVGPGTGTVTATGTRRFAFLQFFYNTIAAGTQNTEYDVWWTVSAVYGTHGLPQRGSLSASGAPGFYPSDIFRDALRRSKARIVPGVIEDATGLTIAHLIYPQPTGADAIADQMAKLMAWHWGVWEPQTTLDDLPTAHFRSPPADATCVVSRSDCIELDPPKVRLDLLYDTAKVSWRDAAGSSGTETVTLTNPLLSETGIGSRTLVLDAGTTTQTAARTFGSFALLLAQRTARGGGYCLLGDTVGLPGGGRKPACLLKAGRDRIRITDLPDAGPLHESDSRRYDTFHVRRCETSVVNGVPQTRVEFDGGADLMEVLQARLAVQVPLG